MCGFCGCSELEDVEHEHEHENEHEHEHNHRIIEIEKDILTENQHFADQNRHYFEKNKILTLNFVSSPGSGKTSLLIETIQMLKNKYDITVIEGDQQTDLDAKRIAETGVSVLQINTGKACHLDAHRISHALTEISLQKKCFLFIENVGNLVCPALFDLGEAAKIVILSVTEGDDKPLKYPYMFDQSQLLIINKIDLLPYVSFNIDRCIENAKRINPRIKILKTSATTGEGISEWCNWLQNKLMD
ncbi:MAG: hydrogenase nickel incorporation protein HypB [Gammaproteobacteria bacterium]|nr:hydrogenase nickel incorporation protein HypB [Gammaproteobacteria bacterium]